MTPFDPHDHRDSLKLLRQERDQSLWENRDGVGCPVCDRPFERVVITRRRQHRLTPSGELCLVRDPDRVLLFTH